MKPSKILLIIKGDSLWIGGLHYIKNLVKSLKYFNKDENIDIKISILVYVKEQSNLFNDILPDIEKIYVYNEIVESAGIVQKLIWKINKSLFNIYHPVLDYILRTDNFDFAYPCLPRKNFKFYRFAEWIPDFQYKHFPDGSNLEEIEGRKKDFNRICMNAPLVYVSSKHAKADCEELFPISKGKLFVMPFCVFSDDILFNMPIELLRKKYSIPEKYFIVSNLLAPTKNLAVLIKAISLLKEKNLDVYIVVTGDLHDYRNPGFKNQVFQLINELNVRENFIILGLLDRMEQKELLANSLAIIQPSRFEGWNTLVEEAKCLGKRIILSDIPVHLEQNPLDGTFFRDNDDVDLAEKIKNISQKFEPAKVHKIGMVDEYKKNAVEFSTHFLNVSLGKVN